MHLGYCGNVVKEFSAGDTGKSSGLSPRELQSEEKVYLLHSLGIEEDDLFNTPILISLLFLFEMLPFILL